MSDAGAGEFGMIAKYCAPLAAEHAGAFGLCDDGAVLECPPGAQWVMTVDALVAGRHFLAADPPELIARKLLRVNLSDLAAMGAEPYGYFLTLALPDKTDEAWIADFMAGFQADQSLFGGGLMGGDTVATPGPLVLSLTAIGQLRQPGTALRRSGAKPGDQVYISGSLGDAALGLLALKQPIGCPEQVDRAALIQRYRLPQPRLSLGQELIGIASAAMDISDGLLGDLAHLAKASGCGIEIAADQIPLSEAAASWIAAAPDLISAAMTGGDDYELAFTAPFEQAAAISALASRLALPLTRIGNVVTGSGVTALDRDNRPLRFQTTGYQHF